MRHGRKSKSKTIKGYKRHVATDLESDAIVACARGRGRGVSIAHDEPRQEKLRRMMKTKTGRQKFRERVPVEHRLAHIGRRQGHRARYRGVRKNLYDLRRAAAIQNLETAQRKAA